MFASDFKVLAESVVFLLVKVGLHHDVDVTVPTPEPVKSVSAEGSDVGNMELHAVLCVSCLFRRCAMWWIIVWCFRLR